MNDVMKMSVVEMELAGMDGKLAAMIQTMTTSREDADKLLEIQSLIDKFRRELGIRIETAKYE